MPMELRDQLLSPPEILVRGKRLFEGHGTEHEGVIREARAVQDSEQPTVADPSVS